MATPSKHELGMVDFGDPVLVGNASPGCVVEFPDTHEFAVVTTNASRNGTMIVRLINIHGEMPFLDQARRVHAADAASFMGFWDLNTPPI